MNSSIACRVTGRGRRPLAPTNPWACMYTLMDESTLIALHPKHSRCLTSTVSVLKHSLLVLLLSANKQLTTST